MALRTVHSNSLDMTEISKAQRHP